MSLPLFIILIAFQAANFLCVLHAIHVLSDIRRALTVKRTNYKPTKELQHES